MVGAYGFEIFAPASPWKVRRARSVKLDSVLDWPVSKRVPEALALAPAHTFPGSCGAVGASLPQPGDGGKDHRGAQGYYPLEVHQRLEVVVERFVREEHLHGYVHEERGAGVDEDGEPVQQGSEQRGPEDDQRYRRRQT